MLPVLVLAVSLAACGGGSPSSSGRSTASTSVSTATGSGSSTTYDAGPTGANGGSGTSLPTVANATNLTAEPVVSAGQPPLPNTLETKDLVQGNGAEATGTSTVLVKYVGADYTTGQDFTSTTWKTNKPTSLSLTSVVPGFSQGIVGMKVGGRREIVIPPALGYGPSGSGSAIKPNETLVFVVDLKSVS